MPSAAPRSVGTTTDQPTSPIMPKPNQTPGDGLRRARSFRAALAPTARMNAVSGFSLMMKPRYAADKIALHSRHHRAGTLLAFTYLQKLALHRLVELAEV